MGAGAEPDAGDEAEDEAGTMVPDAVSGIGSVAGSPEKDGKATGMSGLIPASVIGSASGMRVTGPATGIMSACKLVFTSRSRRHCGVVPNQPFAP